MPGNSQAIRAGRAFVELFADDSALARGLKAAQAKLRAFGGAVRSIGAGLAGLGVATLAPLAAAAKKFAEIGDVFDKSSLRTGVAPEALSQLAFAAEQSGASLETLEKGIRIMQKNLLLVQQSGGAAADALALVGISVKDLVGLNPEQQFLTVADAISKIQDDSTQAAVAMQIFGRSGAELVPLLKGGKAGIQDLRDEADRLGLTFTQLDATSGAELTDAFNRMHKAIRAIVLAVGGALAPALSEVATNVAAFAASVSAFLRENRGLVIAAALASAAVLGLGAAFIVIGTTITGVASVLGLIGAAIAAILSPLGLLVVGIAAGAAAAVTFSGQWSAAIDLLTEKFGQLKAFVVEVVGGIADALSAGDVRLAAEILWAGVLVAFENGKSAVLKVWLDLKFTLIKAWQDAGFVIAETWQNSMAAIKTAVLSTVDFILDKYLATVKSIAQAMANVIGFITGQEINVTEDDIAIARIVRPLQEAVKQSRRAIEEENQATLGVLEEAWKQSGERIAKQRAAALAGADGGAEEARKQLDALIAQAAAAKQAALEERAQRAQRAEDDRNGLTELAKSSQELSAQGTFSSLRASGALSVADKTSKKLDDIVGQLKLLNRKADNGLAFGGD
jgi:hypothetical protein